MVTGKSYANSDKKGVAMDVIADIESVYPKKIEQTPPNDRERVRGQKLFVEADAKNKNMDLPSGNLRKPKRNRYQNDVEVYTTPITAPAKK
jgi:hypothetical protein